MRMTVAIFALALMPFAQAREPGTTQCLDLLLSRQYEEALTTCLQAAEKGDVPTQFRMGLIYHMGWGVTQDYVQAYKWFNIASANGLVAGLGQNNRDQLAEEMSPSEVAEAQRLAREWLDQHGR